MYIHIICDGRFVEYLSAQQAVSIWYPLKLCPPTPLSCCCHRGSAAITGMDMDMEDVCTHLLIGPIK